MALLHGRRFAPSLIASLLALVGIASVAHLGVWQLNRAAEKRAILEQIAAGASSVKPFTPDDKLPRYQAVSASGRYDTTHQVLLDNMPSTVGMPGYRVLTPFELDNGAWILVDRGWLPIGATRTVLPSVDVATRARTIVGRLDDLPRPGMRLASTPTGESWPRVMNFPEHADLERALGRPLAQQIVRLDPAQPDGYARTFEPRPDFGPNRHIGYAVQWFAMGLAMLIIYVLVNLKPKHSNDNATS